MSSTRCLGSLVCLLSLTALLTAQGKLDNRQGPGSDSKSDTTSSGGSQYDLPPPPTIVGGREIDEWVKDLNSEDASVRTIALQNIVQFRENAARVVPLVLGRLRDPDSSVRAKTAILFRYLPQVREVDVSRVVKALGQAITSDSESIVRYEAAMTLAQRFSSQSQEACRALIQGARDGRCWEARKACVMALWTAGWDKKTGPNPEATRVLLDRLRYDNAHEVRIHALMGLGGMGRPQDPKLLAEVVRDLETWTRARNVTSRLWANVALVMLGDTSREKKSLDAIAATLRDRQRDTKVAGLQTLKILGEKARSKLDDVLNALTDPDDEVIIAAAGALPRMNDHSPRVIRPLVELTRGGKDHEKVVLAACVALQEIGRPDPDVVKAMENAGNRSELSKECRAAIQAYLRQLMTPKKDKDKGPALVQPVPVDAPKEQARPRLDRPGNGR
jgi:HEAT repeat protein